MVDDALADILRRKTEAERLAIAFDLFRIARQPLRAQLESDHPDWTAKQISGEVARQISQGVVPPGCDLAGWLSLHAADYDGGPWTADECFFVAAQAGKTIGWDEMGEYDRYPAATPGTATTSLP
jgi:hypothetical protein